jgi:hypothetical protein
MRFDRAEAAGLLVKDRRGSSAWIVRATALVATGSVLYACSGRGSLPRAALLQRDQGRRTIRGVVACLHTCIRVVITCARDHSSSVHVGT